MTKRSVINVALTLALIVSWPLMAAAASHGEHSGMAGMEGMAGMTVPAQTIALGDQTIDGIKATAHLNDVQEAMAKAGMETTHHLMILFTDQAGTTMDTGVVAIKVTSPDGTESEALSMHGMGGSFGVDLKLAHPGDYQFAVGTKFADDKKRQFVYSTSVK